MTQSCPQEGVRGNRRVPPEKRADAQHRPARRGFAGEPVFPRAPEPEAREA